MILGIDGNFFLHRAFFTQGSSVNPTAAIARRFVSMVCKDAIFVKARRVIVAFDGNRVFRYGLYKEYKSNRHKGKLHEDGPSCYDHLGGLMEYLACCGLPSVQLSKYEADDVLCSVATNNPKVTISVRDKDAYQYLRPGVALIDPITKPEPTWIRHTDVERIFGVPPSLCVDLQTLAGDKIDNIQSLVSKAKAIRGLKTHGSLRQWLDNDPEFRREMRARKDVLQLNRTLVKLVKDIQVDIPTPVWNHGPEMTLAYTKWREFCNPKSRGLF